MAHCLNHLATEDRSAKYVGLLDRSSKKWNRSTEKFASFELTLKGIGAFPNPKNPRVIWVGTDKIGGDCLVELSKKVGIALESFGLKPDKPFKPHITIFRIKRREEDIRRKLEESKDVEFGIQKVSSIKLRKSQLTPDGPIYSDLVEVKGVN